MSNFHIDKKHSLGRSTLENYTLGGNIKYAHNIAIISKFLVYTKKYLNNLNKFKQNYIYIIGENESRLDKSSLREIILQRKPKVVFVHGFQQGFDLWPDKVEYDLVEKSKRYNELSEKLSSLTPVIAHYRLGRVNDNWEHSWGALSPMYILNSLLVLKSNMNVEKQKIWIFSNDLEHAKQLFLKYNSIKNYDVDFIDDASLSAAEVLKLFSNAKYLICSNSTFSLIAAKIGNVPNVIVPSELSKNSEVRMPLPSDWIRVKSLWL